ncbi:hypothetical protein HKBW3C_02083 [Candidatus Hakubella thermalkaliphila]|nr:hypothetical protein HKBW3C_02083 [Candidatus Hakubella thermalkaliphila]
MEKLVPELTIRSARKEDLPALAEIFEEGFNRELIAVLGRTPRRKLGEDLFSFLEGNRDAYSRIFQTCFRRKKG